MWRCALERCAREQCGIFLWSGYRTESFKSSMDKEILEWFWSTLVPSFTEYEAWMWRAHQVFSTSWHSACRKNVIIITGFLGFHGFQNRCVALEWQAEAIWACFLFVFVSLFDLLPSWQALGIDDGKLLIPMLLIPTIIFVIYQGFASTQDNEDFFDTYDQRRR